MTSLMMASGMRLLMASAQPLVTQTTAAALSVGVLNRLPLGSSSVGPFTTSASFRYKSTATPHVATGDEDPAAQKVMPHKGLLRSPAVETVFPGPVYASDYLEKIKPVHVPVLTMHQRLAFMAITIMRKSFDVVTGYDKRPGHMTEAKWLRRAIFLETVAGVPGMVAGMLRHMRSLRSLQKDNGWIHTLLEEAENERQHLLTFLNLRQPGPLFRLTVLLTQGIFFNIYLLAYIISPKVCHAFVGYLEEEAVKTYTHILEEIDAGRLWVNKAAPKHAVDYWHLGENATMRDVILAIRADEACHSHVNHTFSHTKPTDPSPFTDPKTSHLVPQEGPSRL